MRAVYELQLQGLFARKLAEQWRRMQWPGVRLKALDGAAKTLDRG
jgi:hypothetical protein